jgi:hypothetical protein
LHCTENPESEPEIYKKYQKENQGYADKDQVSIQKPQEKIVSIVKGGEPPVIHHEVEKKEVEGQVHGHKEQYDAKQYPEPRFPIFHKSSPI